jgi:hypothetical protein
VADRELPDGARLRPEDDVRGDLLAAGVPDDLVATEEPTGPDDVVLTVTGGEPRPGSRVVARFGGLTVVDPSPGTPTAEELERRRALAEAILANPTTHASEEAAAVLRSADVDMRLLSLLAVLTAREGVDVAAFPRDDGAEGPARSVLLTAVGGAPVGSGEPATAALTTWLDAQLPPFAPRVRRGDRGRRPAVPPLRLRPRRAGDRGHPVTLGWTGVAKGARMDAGPAHRPARAPLEEPWTAGPACWPSPP